MTQNADKTVGHSWSNLSKELRKRTKEPFRHPSFVFYFLAAVLGAGGAGFWLELNSWLMSSAPTSLAEPPNPLGPLRTAVITFFPALAGSACMQVILAEEDMKSLRAFSLILLFCVTVVAVVVSQSAVSNEAALILGFVCSLAAFWSWWIANAKQKDLLDSDHDAPVGGDTQADLAGAGSLAGFEH